MKKFSGKRRNVALILLLACVAAAVAYSTDSYTLSRFIAAFNAGGNISSGNYEMQSSAGESVSGQTSSGKYQMSAGFLTYSAPIPVDVEPEDDLPDYIYVYPNPFRPGSGTEYDADFITFANIPDVDEIKIYSLAGELLNTIRKEPDNGNVRWKPANRAGRRLASGVYIYHIHRKQGKIVSGKFSVIY